MDTMTVVLVAGLAVGLAVGGFVFVLRRRVREEPYYHFRCPHCQRRLRYQARQIGHAGQCNNCGSRLTFPPIAQSVD